MSENGIYKGKEYNVKTGKITWEVNDVNTEDSETQGWLRERQGTVILHGGTFDRFNVSDVEVIDAGNGVYKITVNNPGYGDYTTKINRGWRVTEVEAYILFVIRDGKLIQCTYEHGCWAEELMAGKTHHVHYNTAIFAEDISEFDFEFPLPEDWSWE